MDKFTRGVEVVSSAFIENTEGKILVTKSPKWHGKWTIPGGHIDPGETIIDAAIRETKEETGLIVKAIDIVAWGELINPPDFHRPAHLIYFDVYCKLIGGELKLDERELTNFKWVKPKDALKLDLGSGYPKVFNQLINYLQAK